MPTKAELEAQIEELQEVIEDAADCLNNDDLMTASEILDSALEPEEE